MRDMICQTQSLSICMFCPCLSICFLSYRMSTGSCHRVLINHWLTLRIIDCLRGCRENLLQNLGIVRDDAVLTKKDENLSQAEVTDEDISDRKDNLSQRQSLLSLSLAVETRCLYVHT